MNRKSYQQEVHFSSPLPRYAPNGCEAEIAGLPMVREQVEDYLDHVCRPMIDTHSYSVRSELRQELAQHLYSLVQAYAELGDSPETAARKAIDKFGDAEAVARQWRPLAINSKTSRTKGTKRHAGGIAVGFALSGMILLAGGLFAGRVVGARQAMAAEQMMAAQRMQAAADARRSQSLTSVVPHDPNHRQWAASHACTDCHRSSVVRTIKYGIQGNNLMFLSVQ